MRILSILLVLFLLIFTSACDSNDLKEYKSYSATTTKTKPVAHTQTLNIKDQKLAGMVRGVNFSVDRATFKNNILSLKKGKAFFADASVSIFLFFEDKNDSLTHKTITFPKQKNQSGPHIHLGVKKEKKRLPNTEIVMRDYQLVLKFKRAEKLGIPFSIKLNVPQHNTQIEGNGFATFDDVKVKSDVVDIQNNSLDTLKYLGEAYIEKNHSALTIIESFGVRSSSFGKKNLKTGFIGFEVKDKSQNLLIKKLQFLKDKDGWKVVNELSQNQIHQAHPIDITIEGNLSTVEGRKAKIVAAQQLENHLKSSKEIKNIRSTSINCYLTKTAKKASCLTSYKLKVDGKPKCHRKNYLLEAKSKQWQFNSEIEVDQRVDYKTGDLIQKKRSSFFCW